MNRTRRTGKQTEAAETTQGAPQNGSNKDNDVLSEQAGQVSQTGDVDAVAGPETLAEVPGAVSAGFEADSQPSDLSPAQNALVGQYDPDYSAQPTEAQSDAISASPNDLAAAGAEPTADSELDEGGAAVAEEGAPDAILGMDSGSGPLLAADVTSGSLSPSQVGDQTAPLGLQTQTEELTPLPVNAIVDGRYVAQSLLHHMPERNLYRVSTRKQQRCETCGRIVSQDVSECPHCGSELTGQLPADFYLMAESFRPEALMQDPQMMELNLYHPNLVPVIDFFSHKPFGMARYYAVAEPRQGVRLSQLSLPRPGGQVLNWAMQLADALDYLHSRGVVGAGAEADDILVQGDRASLASLQNARANVEQADELAQLQSMDLARLASTIYEAYTGNPASMTPEGVLPMPSSAPEQVGAAFRAAIEPVQGMAPSISAGRWRDLLALAIEAVAELERPGRPVAFLSAGLTDVGRLREQNQDSFGMFEFVQGSVERPMRSGLYIVADGLGGHKGGELASALAVQAFCGEIMARVLSGLVTAPSERSQPANEAILQGMVRAVQSANDRIYKGRDNRHNDMGTTVVAALLAGGKAYIVNVGDSRIYLYSKPRTEADIEAAASSPLVRGTSPLAGTAPLPGTGALEPPTQPVEVEPEDKTDYRLTQVSVDHSLVHRLVELGQLDPEEAKVHPHRNFIYRSLGGAPPIEVDTFVRTVHPGDRLLLCSDGLNSMIEDEDIEDVLAHVDSPEMAAQRLISLANDAGGHDNITTIVVNVTGYLPMPEHPTALNNM